MSDDQTSSSQSRIQSSTSDPIPDEIIQLIRGEVAKKKPSSSTGSIVGSKSRILGLSTEAAQVMLRTLLDDLTPRFGLKPE